MYNKYVLVDVVDKKTTRKFLDFPATLYKNDKNWIRPLDEDILNVFDAKKNKLLRNGDAVRWLVQDNKGQVVGKIAAFYSKKESAKNETVGGCGFFDCINDKKVSEILFDASKLWLQSKGMSAMDGPINFGSRENFWGCLSDGYYEPIYKMPYNFAYYNDLFEAYGFKNYFNQFTFHVPLTTGALDPVIYKKAKAIRTNPDVSFSFVDKHNPNLAAYHFHDIFNAAWANFPGVKPITLEQSKALFNSMKRIIDPKLIIFAYHKNNPIAFFIMIPDLYQIIKKFNGKFHIFNKLKLIYYLKLRKICTRAVGLIFGVIPEFQGKGVAEGMIVYFEDEVASGVKYRDLEMNWIGDFNPKMIRLVKQIGGKVRKTHITYRYNFDRDKVFERATKV